MRNLLIALSFLVFALLPGTALAVSVATPYQILPSWTDPVQFSVASFGSDVIINATYRLPEDWAGNILVLLDGVRKSAVGGSPTLIALTNLAKDGAVGTKNGSFTYNIGPVSTGDHVVTLEFWGGEACAINSQLNKTPPNDFQPACPQVSFGPTINFIPKQQYARPFSGGLPPSPNLVVGTSLNFVDVGVGTSQTRDFTLQNNGSQTLTGSMSGILAPFACPAAGCGYSIPAGSTIPFTVSYNAPASAQASSITVNFSCTGQSACPLPSQDRTITGNSVASPSAGQISVSPGTIDYGGVILNRPYNEAVTLTNVGGAPLTGNVTFPSGEFACAPSCAYTVNPGVPVNITIIYTPNTGSGIQTDVATFTGGVSRTLNIKSEIVSTPVVDVTPDSYTAGMVPAGTSQTFFMDVRNNGAGTLSGNVTVPVGSPFTCIANCAFAGLVFGGPFHRVTMQFLSPGTPVNVSAVFSNSGGASRSVTLTANGAAAAPISLTTLVPHPTLGKNGLEFGEVLLGVTTPSKYIRVTNTSSAPLTIRFEIWEKQFTCTLNCLPSDLPPGASKDVFFQFRPSKLGPAYGGVSFFYGLTIAESVLAELDGIGTAPTLEVFTLDPKQEPVFSNQTVNFGTTTFGTPTQNKTIRLLLQNDGVGTLGYSVVRSANFVMTTPIRNTLPFYDFTGAQRFSVEIPLTFTPTAIGKYQQDVRVEYNIGDGVVRTLPFTVVGASVDEPILEVTPLARDFGAVIGGVIPPPRKSFTVRNLGSKLLSGTAGIETYANYLLRTTGTITTLTNNEGAFTCIVGCTFTGLTAASAPHVVEYQFDPTAIGNHRAYPRFLSNGGDISGLLTGVGSSLAQMSLSPVVIPFGQVNQGSYKPAIIRITNTGSGTLVGTVAFSNTHYRCDPSASCDYNVLPGAPRDMTIWFLPLNTGLLPGTVTFTSNAVTNPQTVSMTGEGMFVPTVDIGVTGGAFGSVAVNKSKIQRIFLENRGTSNFPPGTFKFSSPRYRCVGPVIEPISGECTYSLTAAGTPNSTAFMDVQFTPNASGVFNSTFSLSGAPGVFFDLSGRGISPSVKFIER